MDISTNLASLLGTLSRNRDAVAKNLKQAEQAISQLDDASLASIRQLLAKWEHPQTIGQFVNALTQADGLQKAIAELDTALAVLQTASDDEDFLADAQSQLEANAAGTNSNPLPAAGPSCEPAATAQVSGTGMGSQASTASAA